MLLLAAISAALLAMAWRLEPSVSRGWSTAHGSSPTSSPVVIERTVVMLTVVIWTPTPTPRATWTPRPSPSPTPTATMHPSTRARLMIHAYRVEERMD